MINRRLNTLIFIALGVVGIAYSYAQTKAKNKTTKTLSVLKNTNDTISISIVGDLMVGSNYPSAAYLPDSGMGNILKNAMPYLNKTDLRIGNLESCISDTIPVFKECGGSQCYAFRTPFYYANWYKEAHFDYLNLANNHSFDFGIRGTESTLNFLKKNNIRTSGVLQHTTDTLTIRNTRFGFVSFAPHNNCLNMNNDSIVVACINNIRQVCDVLIVFFHGGGEGAAHTHTPHGHEIFLEQDRGDVRHFAHLCIGTGADLVIGSGPHVARGMELYKNKLIAYSLGNFATYHLFNLKGPNCIAPLLQLSITNKGVLVDSKIISFLQKNEGIPVFDSINKAFTLIQELSEKDFGYIGVK